MTAQANAWSARSAIALGAGAIVVLFAVLGVWGSFATISGAVVSNGMIQVESLRQVVQHPDGGVVGRIDVKEGDDVTAGQVLIRFDDTILQSELTTVTGQLAENAARRARLEAERDDAQSLTFPPDLLANAATDPDIRALLDGQANLFEARRNTRARQIEQLSERKAQIAVQIKGVEAQLASARRQTELIGKELSDQRGLLEKGLAQASRVLALEREAARLDGSIGELEAAIARGRGQIAEIELQILQIDTTRREAAIAALRDVSLSEIELRERQLALRETLARMDVRSPVAGKVYGLTVHALRSVVRPADPILYVVPSDSPFVIQSRIDAIHIDQIRVGQEALLRFSTFDQRTTPELTGTVTRVSPDIFVDQVTGAAYYTAEIVPKDGELTRLGDVELLPGMPVEAFIRTGDRTPLSYLVKPLTDYFNRAMRES